MSFELKSISTERKLSPYITYGGNQELKINKIELVVSKNTGSYRAVLHMETRPIDTPNFTPVEGAQGKVGKIGCGVYMKHENQKTEFLQKLKQIAAALGVEDDVNEIKGDIFEDVVKEIESVVVNKFGRYTIFGEEYIKADTKTGLRLMLPRWGFVESLDIPESQTTLVKFNENDPNHLKKIKQSGGNSPQEFPFV